MERERYIMNWDNKVVKKKIVLLLMIITMLMTIKNDKIYAFDTGDMTYEEGAKEYEPTEKERMLETRKNIELYIFMAENELSEKYIIGKYSMLDLIHDTQNSIYEILVINLR